MKRLAVVVSLSLGVSCVVLGSSWEAPYGPPLVVVGHDREPYHLNRDVSQDAAPVDDECNEQHHLQPDGDNDCDDPGGKGVPEPGPLPLLALGAGVLALSQWRRRG